MQAADATGCRDWMWWEAHPTLVELKNGHDQGISAAAGPMLQAPAVGRSGAGSETPAGCRDAGVSRLLRSLRTTAREAIVTNGPSLAPACGTASEPTKGGVSRYLPGRVEPSQPLAYPGAQTIRLGNATGPRSTASLATPSYAR